MSLFTPLETTNLLPLNGEVYYLQQILNSNKAFFYFNFLYDNLNWKPDEATIYGKQIYTKRKIAWFADTESTFSYSGAMRKSANWTPELLIIKEIVEAKSNFKFNSCLLNLYHSGLEGMSWHSDKTKEFGKNTTIATLSLGAERRFDFIHTKTKEKISIALENNSLLIMTGDTQVNWLHQIPTTTKITKPRISLTFRQLL